MKVSASIRIVALAMATSLFAAACGSDPSDPAERATVSGVVTSAGGAAVEGASVSIGSRTTTSDADGSFELANLTVGSVTIVTTAAGFDSKSESVELDAGVNSHDIVLTPTPTATVSGVVTALGGALIEGASVTVGSVTATTGADGEFELASLPVGSATIVTSAEGYDSKSENVTLSAGTNDHDVVLTPTPTASLSGVITAATGAPIEGATVQIGSAIATTGADGHYELHNLGVGTKTVVISAPLFDQKIQNVGLAEGANVHNVELEHKTLFTHGNQVAYLPLGVTEYKVAIVFLPGLQDPSTGLPLDSRPLVRGTAGFICAIWCAESDRMQVRNRALDLLGGDVALIGTTTLTDNTTNYTTLLQALTEFGTQSQHPELANIPILFVGHSMGGCTSYGFSRVHGERVAGFLTMKGGCHNPGPELEAGDVPGHFLIGALDEAYRAENITGVFEQGRGNGAPWAISIDPYQHGPILDYDLMFDWIEAVLAERLPLTSGDPLLPITEADGWLGNRTTGAIATYACYTGVRSSASWLPDRETAVEWQQMKGGTAITEDC